MLVQLARLSGVQYIIGTVGKKDKENYVKELGANIVCTYETFVEEVFKEKNNQGANVIFDSVAGDVQARA